MGGRITNKTFVPLLIAISLGVFHIVCSVYYLTASRASITYSSITVKNMFKAYWKDRRPRPVIENTVNVDISVPTYRPGPTQKQGPLTIAIGGGITSMKLTKVKRKNVRLKFQFFRTFMPTFCRTASAGYNYAFYLAYDINDRVFNDRVIQGTFRHEFMKSMQSRDCRSRSIVGRMTLVQCSHSGMPTWAQNDAMLEAYLDNADYFYRINDDTRMITPGWTEIFISALDRFDPPRVGVVGPRHSGGNTGILTYDFVHRTHIDIFGFYYPHLFTDWWGDNWITRVYMPGRSMKISAIKLAHTTSLGRRYRIHVSNKHHMDGQIAVDIGILNRYLMALKSNQASGVKADGRKVISMSLYGQGRRYVWGVIRNAQLIPVFLPEWTLRVYIPANPSPPYLAVPPRIITRLKLLGVEIFVVPPPTKNSLAPKNWRLLVADDQRLDFFLIRDADSRLSEREAAAIREWVSTAEKNGPESAVVHCFRDHPKHVDRALITGLWGGRPRALRERLGHKLTDMIKYPVQSNSSSITTITLTVDVVSVLNQVVWPAVSDAAFCHDSVSPCDKWTPSSRHSFPTPRQNQTFLGMRFYSSHEPNRMDFYHSSVEIDCGISESSHP